MRGSVAFSVVLGALLLGCQDNVEQVYFGVDPDYAKSEIQAVVASCDKTQVKGLKAGLLGLTPKNKKQRASARLLENFVQSVETSKDCEEIQEAAEQYTALNAINEKNSPNDIKFNVAYHPLEKKQVEKAFRDYGDLYIDPSKKDINLDATYEAWSGYWYPVSKIELLTGENSPMARFDRLLRKSDRKRGARQFEVEQFADLDRVDTWEGHCHAWSLAAVVFPEPTEPKKINGVEFSVSDIKALYTKAAGATPYAQYGITYKGTFDTDGTYQDIRPEAFHKVISDQLHFGEPVLIDDDAGHEVWTRPVMGLKAQVTPDPEVRDAVRVKAWLGLIKQKNDLTEELTNARDRSYMVLSYRLYLGEANAEGHRKVIAGEWTGDSRDSHPDTILVPDPYGYKSHNPVINKNMDLIERFF